MIGDDLLQGGEESTDSHRGKADVGLLGLNSGLRSLAARYSMHIISVLVLSWLAVVAAGAPRDEPRATLTVKVQQQQVVGVPILLELTVKNTGTQSIKYWCGGPDSYPGAHRFQAIIVDERGQEQRMPLSNGQYWRGSGDDKTIAPDAAVTFPAATAALPAGKYTLRSVVGEKEGYQPAPNEPMVVTWPAIDAKVMQALELREDPEAQRAFGEGLLGRVRKGEPFALHVAAEYRIAAVLDAMVKDMESDDAGVAVQACEVIFKMSEFPKGLGAVIKRSMLKHLKAEDSQEESDLRSMLAALAAREGSDESLDAVLALVDDGLPRPHPHRCWALQNVQNFEQPKAAETLRKLLTYPDAWVRFKAASGLSRRRDPAAVPVLVETFKDRTSDERDSALYSLSDYWDDPRAVAAIDQAAKDTDARVRQAAERARGYLEDNKKSAAIRAKESGKTPEGAGRAK